MQLSCKNKQNPAKMSEDCPAYLIPGLASMKAGTMELQFSRDPVVSLIFEDTLDGDTE